MKRAVSLFLVLSLVFIFSLPVSAAINHVPDKDPQTECVYLYNMNTQKAVFQKNAEKTAYPASLVKIMTCILALENTADLDHEIVTYPNYVQDYLYNYQKLQSASISLAGLLAGEQMPMRDMLYGLMLRSGNEVAMIIADHIAGGQDEFVAMMNARAKELGATNTNFTNANGLFDPKQVTTARDMALITEHAMGLPGFMDIVSTTSYVAGPTNKNEKLEWSSTIPMMTQSSSYYYPYLKGIKTGTLPESGRCFISSATRDGFTYLLVLMDAPYLDTQGNVLEGNAVFEDTIDIYNWVFENFKVKSLVEKNRIVTEIPLRLNMDRDHISLVTSERFTYLMPKDAEPASTVDMVFDVPEYMEAPVKKGDPIGRVRLMLYGEEVGVVELLSADTVDASRLLLILEQLKAILRSFWFKFGVIFFVLLIILYIVLMIVRNRNRRRSAYRPRRRL